MGGGNAQKSAMARERNAKAKAAASKGSQLKSNQSMLKCKVCMQTFAQGTTKKAELVQHCLNKHSTLKKIKNESDPAVEEDFKKSFPDFGKVEVVAKSEYKPDKGAQEKKKKYKRKG